MRKEDNINRLDKAQVHIQVLRHFKLRCQGVGQLHRRMDWSGGSRLVEILLGAGVGMDRMLRDLLR
jgi:hypothetical protein